jgi:hypothetical protein
MAATEQIHSASTYCKACRETTWFCDPAAPSLDAAVIDFSLHVQRVRRRARRRRRPRPQPRAVVVSAGAIAPAGSRGQSWAVVSSGEQW